VHWPAGEVHAHQCLQGFIEHDALAYAEQRDLPALDGTSALSPYLAIGALSTRQCMHAALNANEGRLDGGRKGLDTWLNELIWREFYRHLLVAFPEYN
jgi:deoxyribodipyrimidine photo-lyase